MTLTVAQLIRSANPVVHQKSTVSEAAIQMTTSKFGAVSVVDEKGSLVGVLTDGDLRRAISLGGLARKKVSDLMSPEPKCVDSETILHDAVSILRREKVDSLIVVDGQNRPVGILDVQDLLHDGLLKP
jgi:arabinose-5-phosphate isomerase